MKHYEVLDKRRAGILLHITSLPGGHDHGDMGHQAYRFIEFLEACGITVWQTLPLGPTHEDLSPYQCLSVHAGNPLLISMDWLIDRGWLEKKTIQRKKCNKTLRKKCLGIAFDNFMQAKDKYHDLYQEFITSQAYWLEDYALFIAIRSAQKNTGWMNWSAKLRDREPAALKKTGKKLQDHIEYIKFEQFIFFQQWIELKQYAHDHGVSIFGDMPIFVAHDSAEVWAHREFFNVDKQGRATHVAGVPPDYFSENGQRWGNPLYTWKAIQQDQFGWWINRMRTQLLLFDIVRIDHFRGFEANWEIPAEEETAINGQWVKTPGMALLNTLYEKFNPLPLIAEDLGIITDEVNALRDHFNIPGMKVLQFAFSGDSHNPYLPHNCVKNCVIYTGTHDNDTTLSWFNSLSETDTQHVLDYLKNDSEDMPWPIIRSAMASVARLCVLPMQDILSLGEGHRMNTPGTQENNWQWRFKWNQIPDDLAQRLRQLATLYDR
ncbi:MAG: 4-alpha-glucanotransferase [Gammaproteobacteria bacterium]|nr:4-alpha-glucanotransferase [Gammaproteobacteria bacterium]